MPKVNNPGSSKTKSMKKIVLMIASGCMLATSVIAQVTNEVVMVKPFDHRNNVIFGLKIGTNYSNVWDADGEDFEADSKFGFAGGGFLAIPFGNLFGIQPELLYSQKGFHGKGRILGGGYDFTRTTSFIDVPLFFSIKPVEYITLLVGPQYSYLVRRRDVFANATTTIAQEQEFENDNIRKNILCFVTGFDINMQHFALGGRAGWDVQNNNGDGSSTTPRYKNAWVQVTLGYRMFN